MTIDLRTLFEMIKTTALDARRALNIPIQPGEGVSYLHAYSGFPAYAAQYNRFRLTLLSLYAEEAEGLFPPFPDSLAQIGNWAPVQFRGNLEAVSVMLDQMVVYLKAKLNIVDQEIEEIIDFIEANLRATIRKDPENEIELQDKLEDLFRARGYDFQRDTIVIPYSVKDYRPDFTFEGLDLAVEAKFCNKKGREKQIVEEINSDIPAYQTKYKNAIFVIYDLGFIRDEQAFRSGIESNPDIYVKIIKR
ncbi:MAG: hypothetical protein WCE81_02100 [Halobacteriota archaeon]